MLVLILGVHVRPWRVQVPPGPTLAGQAWTGNSISHSEQVRDHGGALGRMGRMGRLVRRGLLRVAKL